MNLPKTKRLPSALDPNTRGHGTTAESSSHHAARGAGSPTDSWAGSTRSHAADKRIAVRNDAGPKAVRSAIMRLLPAGAEAPRSSIALEVPAGSVPEREKFMELLGRAATLPEGERVRLVSALSEDWVRPGRPLSDLLLRLEVAVETGYLLRDSGALASNPRDSTTWGEGELRRMRSILVGLPVSMRRIDSLHDIVRDRRGESKTGARTTLTGLLARLSPVGTEFGSAHFDSREVRLYDELFLGSKIPGLDAMVAYTTIHEVGHHLLRSDQELRKHFMDLYFFQGGRDDMPYDYGKNDAEEAFAVSLGMYAVAPDKLRKVAPKHHRFFEDRFGESLAQYRGQGLESWAIDLIYRISKG